MEIKDFIKEKKELVGVSARIPKEDKEFIDTHNIKIRELIAKAIKELRGNQNENKN